MTITMKTPALYAVLLTIIVVLVFRKREPVKTAHAPFKTEPPAFRKTPPSNPYEAAPRIRNDNREIVEKVFDVTAD